MFIKKSDSFYSKILISITICLLIITVGLSSTIYIYFQNIALQLINTYIKDSLSQISYSTTFMLTSSKSISLQMYQDTNISKLLYYPFSEAFDDEYNKLSVFNRINSFKLTFPFIHSIYVYNGNIDGGLYTYNRPIQYNKNNFFDADVYKIFENFQNYNNNSILPRKISTEYTEINKLPKDNVFTFMFTDNSKQRKPLQNAIIINISQEYLQKIIKSMNTNTDNDVFLIDNHGKMASKSKLDDVLTDVSSRTYIKQILSSPEASGYFIENVNGSKSVITYVSPENTDLVFVQVTPYSIIEQKINKIKVVTFFIAFIILALGFISAIYLSRRLNNPIKKLQSKLSNFESDKRDTYLDRRQALLKSIVFEGINDNKKFSKSELANFKINFDFSSPLFIMGLKIDHFSDFCDKYVLEDRNLMKFAISNIASELCSVYFVNEAIDISSDQVIILSNTNSDEYIFQKDTINKIALDIQAAVQKYLQISISIFIGTQFNDLEKINSEYIKIIDASHYRLTIGHQCIVNLESLQNTTEEQNKYNYPYEKEKAYCDALLSGKIQDAKNTLIEITNGAIYLQSFSHSTILRLALATDSTIATISKNLGISIPYSFDDFMAKLNTIETLEEFRSLFFTTFGILADEFDKIKSEKYDNLVNDIYHIIEREYHNPILSPDFIAYEVGMSSKYISLLFKKHSQWSLSDYIKDFRLEKSKERLIASEDSIDVILEQSGFTSRGNFYSLFKKKYGMTPNDYRLKNRK